MRFEHKVPSVQSMYYTPPIPVYLNERSALSQGGKDIAKGKKSVHMLVAWEIWCERNRRVFRNQEKSLQQLLDKIQNEIKL